MFFSLKKTFFAFILSVVSINAIAQCGDIIVPASGTIQTWDVEVGAQGEIFAISGFTGTVTLGEYTFTQEQEWGLLITHTDMQGTVVSAHHVEGQNWFFTTKPSLEIDPAGNIIIAASQFISPEEHVLRVEAYDRSWVQMWGKSYTVTGPTSNLPFEARVMPYDMAVDMDGSIYVTGALSGTMSFGENILSTAEGVSETFLLKLNYNQNESWTRLSTGSTGTGRAWTMELDNFNNLYIAGNFTGDVSFGNLRETATNSTFTNPYIAKFDTTGTVAWIQSGDSQGPSNFYDIDTDTDGQVYVVGNFVDNILFDENPYGSFKASNGMILQMDAFYGMVNWFREIGGSGDSEYLTHINVTSTGSIFTGGQITSDTVMFYYEPLMPPGKSSNWYLFNLDLSGFMQMPPSENEFLSYAVTLDAEDNLVVGDFISENGELLKHVNMNTRPQPILRFSVDNTVFTEFTVARAYSEPGYYFQWFKDGVLIQGQNSDTLTISENGYYQVEVRTELGCVRMSNQILVTDGVSLASDSLVLVDIYNSLNGREWNNNTGWLTDPLDQWHGVSVIDGRVRELYLFNNNLNGLLPASIANLTALRYIDLNQNNISGNLPADFWKISSLEGIQLCCGNNISVEITPEIGNLTNLSMLDLGGNTVSGALPDELYRLVNLQYFNLWGENITVTGEIPAEVGNLINLIAFNINGNLTGNLPVELTTLPNIQEINLSNNNLSGELPVEFSSTIIIFDILHNNISGTVPEALWQIEPLEVLNVGFNPNLQVVLPSYLSSLTNLKSLNISGTIPIKGPLGESFFQLVNLEALDIGGHQFEGTVSSSIGNMKELQQLWMWGNKLEGEFPIEIYTLPNLVSLGISDNNFTSIPAPPDTSRIQSAHLQHNFFSFEDIIPFVGIGVPDLQYSPQKILPTEFIEVPEGGDVTLLNPYDTPNSVYEWVSNVNETGIDTKDLTISNASVDDLGGYYALVTHPFVPDLVLRSPFYSVSFAGAPKSFTVDNKESSIADFKSLYDAIYGTNAGDTLYVAGSAQPYNKSWFEIAQPRVIIGPGYFLEENDSTQHFKESAKVQVPVIELRKGAEGTHIYGMELNTSLRFNNNASALQDTLKDVTVIGNKIKQVDFIDDIRDIELRGNYIDSVTFFSTPVRQNSRSYRSISIRNNIIRNVLGGSVSANATYNEMENIHFDHNVIFYFSDSVQDATVTNNILGIYEATSNNDANNVTGGETDPFVNTSGTFSVDSDFILTENSPAIGAAGDGSDAGIFGGDDPYILSGMPPVPSFYSIEDEGRIRIKFSAKNHDEEQSVIRNFNYSIAQDGIVLDQGKLDKIEQGTDVVYTFRPRLGSVTPGGTYSLFLTATDDNGRRNVPTSIFFEAKTVNVNGTIYTSSEEPLTAGQLFMFEVNSEGKSFDTLSIEVSDEGAFNLTNVVIGDYLAMGFADTLVHPNELPTYYKRTVLWEEADTLLIDQENTSFDIHLDPMPTKTQGEGVIAGVLMEEYDDGEDEAGRLLAKKLRRIKGSGVSVRRARRTGKTENEDLELVAYVYTDENGNFSLEGLPEDTYYLNIQYPGYPMNPNSHIVYELGSGRDARVNVEAVVKEGQINVSEVEVLGVHDSKGYESVLIYPNPASDQLYIEFDEQQDVIINMYSIDGVLLENHHINKTGKEAFILDISKYKKGIYLLNITDSSGIRKTARVVIE